MQVVATLRGGCVSSWLRRAWRHHFKRFRPSRTAGGSSREFSSATGGGSDPESSDGGLAPDDHRHEILSAQLEQQRAGLENIVSVDRSQLREQIALASDDDESFEKLTPLAKELRASILTRGPITVAEFMRLCLTHDKYGYYIQGDVFGSKGDFTTSPEISQVFGELLGIWCVSMWQQLGEPAAIQLVELGPGRGTLMADMVRTATKFPGFASALTCHMVEVSPALRTIQRESVCGANGGGGLNTYDDETGSLASSAFELPAGSIQDSGADKDAASVNIHWHGAFADVPHTKGVPCIVIGQEFLDALPVHQFERTERGWCERLVDLEDPSTVEEEMQDEDKKPWFRLVNSPGKTPAVVSYIRDHFGAAQIGDKLEVCPGACAVAQDVALRLQRDGGAALFIDYGPGENEGPPGESARGISKHGFLSFLRQPGTIDVTADVDFAAIRRVVEQISRGPDEAKSQPDSAFELQSAARQDRRGVQVFGPVTQGTFLFHMGIEARMQRLLEAADGNHDEQVQIFEGVQRLVDPERMGGLYKALAFTCLPAEAGSPPAGFGV